MILTDTPPGGVGLFSIPVELILEIATLLPLEDLKSLRQTCKRGNLTVEPPYNARKFHTRRHALVKESLWGLQDLTGSSVRSYLRRLQIGLEYPSLFTSAYNAWDLWFEEPGYRHFQQALAALNGLKVIEIYNDYEEVDSSRSWGLRRRYTEGKTIWIKAQSIRPCQNTRQVNIYGQVMAAIFRAIVSGSFQLTELTIPKKPIGDMAVGPQELRRAIQEPKELARNLGGLKKLHLQIEGTIRTKAELTCPGWQTYLQKLLSAADKSIEELHILFEHFNEGVGIDDGSTALFIDTSYAEYFPELCKPEFRIPRLRVVRFEGLFCTSDHLQTFFQKHKHTLKRITLQSTHIKGEWCDILTMFREDFRLDYLELDIAMRDLSTLNRWPRKTVMPTYSSWTGQKNISVSVPGFYAVLTIDEVLETFRRGIEYLLIADPDGALSDSSTEWLPVWD
ncbi:hypothetical protein ABW19_dt0202640 [Dactylella cylindrospora]|nr:hypothetical protein ABW19_dt0202640 [Dactylella cylindrospora]